MSSKVASPDVSTGHGGPKVESERNSMATTLRSPSPTLHKETTGKLDVASNGNSHASKDPISQEKEVTPIAELNGDKPQTIDCPFCKQRTKTTVRKTGEVKQFMIRAVSGVFFFLVCCVPSMVGWCVDFHYSCSECRMKVAERPHKGRMIVYKPKE